MEYASGGELFERICNAGRFSEDEVSLLDCCLTDVVMSFPNNLFLVLFFASPCRPASFSSNLYRVLAIVIQWYCSYFIYRFLLFYFCYRVSLRVLVSVLLFVYFMV